MKVLPDASKKQKRSRSFGQLLIIYSLVLTITLLALGYTLFYVVFSQLSDVQSQTSRYLAIVQLANHLSEGRSALSKLVFEADTDIKQIQTLSEINAAETRARVMLRQLEIPHEENATQYFLQRGIINGLDFISEQRALLLEQIPLDASGYSRYYTIDTTFKYLIDYVYVKLLTSAVSQNAVAVDNMQRFVVMIRQLAIFLVLVVSVLYSVAIIFIVRSLVHPIQSIVETAAQITKGNLDTPDLKESGPNEIVFLEQSINSMKASLKERITALDENAKLEKTIHQQELQQIRTKRELERARLLTLQAQINPHFLFNAMNTISRTALLGHTDSTAALINDLANIFRYILDQRTTVPLTEELEFISKYLRIQKARFGERLTYEVFCEESLLQVLIPPLIIQPFVENAIIHGLEPLEEGGTVLVQISQNKRKISIQVEDSGIGIEENSMLLIENPDPSNTNTHVGMTNVMERIKLYYGSKASMGITRREPNGTIVKLILPIRKQDMMWS
jgi:two-component system, sensor histidine kinase YesM